jgi:hypothetical protein
MTTNTTKSATLSPQGDANRAMAPLSIKVASKVAKPFTLTGPKFHDIFNPGLFRP